MRQPLYFFHITIMKKPSSYSVLVTGVEGATTVYVLLNLLLNMIYNFNFLLINFVIKHKGETNKRTKQ